MRMSRILAVGMVAAGIALAPTAGGAQTTTPTTGTTSGTACTKGVTYTLIKSRKPGNVEVIEARANIRRFPGTDCPIYASVKRHTKLKATGRRARASKLTWIEVFNKTVGHTWVAEKLVKSVK